MGQSIDELVKLLSDSVSPEVLLNAKLTAKISSILMQERVNRKLTEEHFGEMLGGFSEEDVSAWEHGVHNFTISELAVIFTILRYDVDILLTRKEEDDTE